MAKHVYVVTSGCYSDYGIEAVFDDREMAQKFIDAFNTKDRWDEMNIENWELNPFGKLIKENCKPYFLRIDKDGNTSDIRIENSSYGFGNEDNNGMGFDINGNLYLHVFGKDEAHAVKIANERRTTLIAENKWNPKNR